MYIFNGESLRCGIVRIDLLIHTKISGTILLNFEYDAFVLIFELNLRHIGKGLLLGLNKGDRIVLKIK